MEDYSAFSMESIEAELMKIRKELMDKAIAIGLDPQFAEQCVALAFEQAGRNFMEVNGFVEPKR